LRERDDFFVRRLAARLETGVATAVFAAVLAEVFPGGVEAAAFVAGRGADLLGCLVAADVVAATRPLMPSSDGANGTSSRPRRTTMYSPSRGLPIRTTLPRVPAGTAADAVRTTTRGFSPACTRLRSEATSSSVSAGGFGEVFLRGGTAQSLAALTTHY
jgi:hypothetical protein